VAEEGAVAHALERVGGRGLEQPARLGIAERRSRAFVAGGHGALDAVDRIAGDGVVLTEIIEQGGERRELAADAGRGKLAFLEVLAPGNDGGTGDGAQLRNAAETSKADELLHIDLVGPASSGIGEISEPFEFEGRSANKAGRSGRSSATVLALLTRTSSCFTLLSRP
jgi:hypothetical protein